MSCYHQKKKFLIGNGLGKLGHPPASKSDTLEIDPKLNEPAASEVTSISTAGDRPGNSQKESPCH